MKSPGYVVVGFPPNCASFPNDGDGLSTFGNKPLDGHLLVVFRAAKYSEWTAQLTQLFGAAYAEHFPHNAGERFYRCKLVRTTGLKHGAA
jgi:hypothetical protein